MHERYFADIREGMDVYDVDGDKIGTIGKIYQYSAVSTTTTATGYGATEMARSYLKVDTGFLGLGKDLYIPSDAVSAVESKGVHLSVDKDNIDDMGWDQRPDWIKD